MRYKDVETGHNETEHMDSSNLKSDQVTETKRKHVKPYYFEQSHLFM